MIIEAATVRELEKKVRDEIDKRDPEEYWSETIMDKPLYGNTLSYGNIIRLLYNTKLEKREETFDLILGLLTAVNSKESKRISNALLEEKPEFLGKEKLFSDIAENLLMTIINVATYLNKSLRSVQRMIYNGELKPINEGKRPLLFRYEDVKEILTSEFKKKEDIMEKS